MSPARDHPSSEQSGSCPQRECKPAAFEDIMGRLVPSSYHNQPHEMPPPPRLLCRRILPKNPCCRPVRFSVHCRRGLCAAGPRGRRENLEASGRGDPVQLGKEGRECRCRFHAAGAGGNARGGGDADGFCRPARAVGRPFGFERESPEALVGGRPPALQGLHGGQAGRTTRGQRGHSMRFPHVPVGSQRRIFSQ